MTNVQRNGELKMKIDFGTITNDGWTGLKVEFETPQLDQALATLASDSTKLVNDCNAAFTELVDAIKEEAKKVEDEANASKANESDQSQGPKDIPISEDQPKASTFPSQQPQQNQRPFGNIDTAAKGFNKMMDNVSKVGGVGGITPEAAQSLKVGATPKLTPKYRVVLVSGKVDSYDSIVIDSSLPLYIDNVESVSTYELNGIEVGHSEFRIAWLAERFSQPNPSTPSW